MEHYAPDPILLLKDGSKSLGVFLDALAIDLFSAYLRELKEWNQAYNLTSIKEDFHIVTKHFLDSLSVAPFLKNTRSLLDLGSGAGFPGIPLKISLEHLYVVLLDARLKKVRFLQHIVRSLGLKHIEIIHSNINWRNSIRQEQLLFDAVVSRGTFSPLDLLKTGKNFLNPGGIIIWMYGSHRKTNFVIKTIMNDIPPCFDIRSIKTFFLPFVNQERTITTFQIKF